MFATPYHCVATEMEKPFFFFFKETEGACISLCLLLGGKGGGVRSVGICVWEQKEWKQYNGGVGKSMEYVTVFPVFVHPWGVTQVHF